MAVRHRGRYLRLSKRHGLTSIAATAVLVGGTLVTSPALANPAPAPNPAKFSQTTPGGFNATVPDGVCRVEVRAVGGAGGSVVTGAANTNGGGADITVTYPVVPGQVFTGTVGAGGKPSTGTGSQTGNGGPTPGVGGNGVGSGGRGGTVGAGSTHAGAGGGGGTEVKVGSTTLIVAGGGGGSAGGHATNGGFGGNAGLPSVVGTAAPGSNGENGFDNPNQGAGSGTRQGGQGGQAGAAGAGGVHTTTSSLNGSAGSGQDGGNGGNDPNFDSGGGGGGGYFGGGGGASTTSNGSGNPVAGGNAGGGGGGGSSFVANATPGGLSGSPSGLTSTEGPRLGAIHTGSGADGLVELTWIPCAYDLAVVKSITGPDTNGVWTWTVKVTNNGPDGMTRGDVVTLTDTLPGDVATTKVTGVATPSGVTCDIATNDQMKSPIECSRAFDASAFGGAASGKRGLDKNESITITYTQRFAQPGDYTNTAGVTDRGDQSNNTSSATAHVEPPTTNDGATTGPQGVLQTWEPTPVPGESAPIDWDSLTLLDGDGNPVDDIAIAGEGTYTVVGHEIHFQPEPQFVGTATTVPYRISDGVGQSASGTYTPTVTVVTPTANDDSSEDRVNVVQSVNPLTNDLAGDPSVPLVPSTLTLLDSDGDPVTSVSVPGGVYTIDASDPTHPRIVFTPDLDYIGTPTPVDYRIKDSNGTPAEATYQPKVIADPPTTNDGVTTGPQGVLQTWQPTPVAGQDFAIDWDSLTLLDGDGNPVDDITIAGEGKYTVVGHEIHFQPEPQFVGTATTVPYRISDKGGQHARGTYTPSTLAVAPTAVNDSSVARVNVVQSVDPLTNDLAGDPSVPLVPATLTLLDSDGDPVTSVSVPGGVYTIDTSDPTHPRIVFTPNPGFIGTPTPVDYRIQDTNGTPAEATYQPEVIVDPPATNDGVTTGPQGVLQTWQPTPVAGQDFAIDWDSLTLLDGDGNPVDDITIAGEGKYTVVGHEIHFQPEPQFVGTATTVPYRISDKGGQHARGTYTPSTLAVAPTAVDDATTGWWNTPQSVDPLTNDLPGDPSVPLDPATLTLLDSDGDPATSVTVPDGVYTIDTSDPTHPRIVFTPNPGFIGTPTPVDYRIQDTNGTPAEATYRPEVKGPVASKNLDKSLTCGTDAVFDMTSKVPSLDPSSVMLIDANGVPVLSLTVPGEGTWTADPKTGTITFSPDGCVIGDITTVSWTGFLKDGTPVSGNLDVDYVKAAPKPTKPHGLPNTGGPAAFVLFGGLLSVVLGGAVLLIRRRRYDA